MVEAEADTFKEGQEIKPGELPPGWRSFIGRHQTVYNSFTAKLIFDGKRSRKAIQRTTIDFNNSVMHHVEDRVWQRDAWDLPAEQPDANYVSANLQMPPPLALTHNPSTCIATKFVHTSQNKLKCPVNAVSWTPDGRRLVTGSTSGEFTIWNGLTFNFETIMQAHDHSIRKMRWSHNATWLISADHGGVIKYWQANLNNIKAFQGHKDAVRDLTFSPSDLKFASCSDDSTIKIWNFNDATEERALTGHNWDVKCIDWHPSQGLLASGSKDNTVRLWDPKNGKLLSTLHGHKNTIYGIEWNRNGNWLLTAGREGLCRIFDIRMLKELCVFKGHKNEVNSVAWHPTHSSLFSSGGSDGSVMFWEVGQESTVGGMEHAHESNVWTMDWHPMGHMLSSGSNDHTARFWARNRPAQDQIDVFNPNEDGSADQDDTAALPEFKHGDDQAAVIPGFGGAASAQNGYEKREEEPPHKRRRMDEDRRDGQNRGRGGGGDGHRGGGGGGGGDRGNYRDNNRNGRDFDGDRGGDRGGRVDNRDGFSGGGGGRSDRRSERESGEQDGGRSGQHYQQRQHQQQQQPYQQRQQQQQLQQQPAPQGGATASSLNPAFAQFTTQGMPPEVIQHFITSGWTMEQISQNPQVIQQFYAELQSRK